VVIARGVGKCEENHPGSYGYPTRPEEPYDFCSQCGKPMIWECTNCGVPLPEDSAELESARFCRGCGSPYFPDETVDPTEKPGK
jgi:hypothetical protein